MFVNHMSVLTMENVNFNHNMGALEIISTEEVSMEQLAIVDFHGSNIFANNTDSEFAALYLIQCRVTFQGNTTFLRNKGRNGGAIDSQNSEIYFQGNTMFLENEGEYGGALCLYENVSVIVGQFEVAEVSFVRNHAHKSGGAIYARSSKIVITIG